MPRRYPAEVRRQVIELARSGTKVAQLTETFGMSDAEAKRVGESLDRYFRAFEEGSMPESACGPRIDELSGKLRGLKARREELGAEGPRSMSG